MYAHFHVSVPPHEHYMSVLVCMCNEPAHPYIYIQALTVHLFVSVTAPWWLLFSPSWGGEGEVKCCGSLAGKSVVGRRPIPHWCSSFRDKEVAKRVPRRGRWAGDTAVNQLPGQSSTSIHWPKSHSLIRRAHHLMKRGERKKWVKKLEKWQCHNKVWVNEAERQERREVQRLTFKQCWEVGKSLLMGSCSFIDASSDPHCCHKLTNDINSTSFTISKKNYSLYNVDRANNFLSSAHLKLWMLHKQTNNFSGSTRFLWFYLHDFVLGLDPNIRLFRYSVVG